MKIPLLLSTLCAACHGANGVSVASNIPNLAAQRAGVNQAECLACHKPLDKTSFTFTLKELAAGKAGY